MLYSPLTLDEIVNLEEKLEDVLTNNLLNILITLNRSERLKDFLNLIGCSELIKKNTNGFSSLTNRTIVILGDSQISVEDIIKTIKKCGISRERVELHLDYHLKGFNVESLKYSLNHSLILLGPMPHSIKGKDIYSSLVSRIEGEDGFPPVQRLTANNTLKITKTSIKNAITKSLDNGILTI